jgi:hypothetical protein
MLLDIWLFAGVHLIAMVLLRPVDLMVPFRESRLSALLDDVLHSDSRDKPVRLTLVVVSHVVLAEKTESSLKYNISTFIRGPTAIPSVSPVLSN